jgi:hypothetical protein
MIGLISSTIFPSSDALYWGSPRTCIPSSQRLEQTRKTVDSLSEAGITRIVLADNSGTNWISGTEEFLKPADVHVSDQHQFQNKGISELYLLLNALKFISADTPVLKISGRYHLTNGFNHQIRNEDIVAKVTKYDGVNMWMSTRCYIVKDVAVFEAFLRAILRDLYGYGARIVGPRSLYRILQHSLSPHKQDYLYDDPVQGIEVAAARVLKESRFKVRLVDHLGVQGISADHAQRLIVE